MGKGTKLMIDRALEMTGEKSYSMKTSGVCLFTIFQPTILCVLKSGVIMPVPSFILRLNTVTVELFTSVGNVWPL